MKKVLVVLFLCAFAVSTFAATDTDIPNRVFTQDFSGTGNVTGNTFTATVEGNYRLSVWSKQNAAMTGSCMLPQVSASGGDGTVIAVQPSGTLNSTYQYANAPIHMKVNDVFSWSSNTCGDTTTTYTAHAVLEQL